MSQIFENWLARSVGMLGTLLLVTAVTGCNPPVDKPAPAKPEVAPEKDEAATTDTTPAENMPPEEAPTAEGAAVAPNASPEETADKDALDTTDNSAAVKLGEPADPVDLKD